MKTIEGSRAVAEVVKNCEPDVVACYPITPSTHIVENLAQFYADGELKTYIPVEAEFSAISVLVGAAAAGGRTFTATGSQGLELMHEVLFAASGLRLPIVMVVANRAVSAPLNIWNDHQDSISQRDTGWIQIYCETIQEVVDSIIQAFKIAESVFIPAMVCMDGFYLTHSVEQVDIPEKDKILSYLGKYKPPVVLDSEKPVSMGVYALPSDYQSFREDLAEDMENAKKKIVECDKEFERIFGRKYGGLVDEYKTGDAEKVFIGMGSVMSNAKVAIDELRDEGEKVGALRIRFFRPFPNKELKKILRGKKSVGVFEKDLSIGGAAPLYADVIAALYEEKIKIKSFVDGLGGKDITVEDIKKIIGKL